MTKGKKRKLDESEKAETEAVEVPCPVEVVPYDTKLSFSHIGGLYSIKKMLIIATKDFVNAAEPNGGARTTGLLFHGIPGTGKTFMAMCLVAELNRSMRQGVSLYTINGTHKNKYFGESEKLIKCTFERAKQTAPSVIVIDEMESMCSSREESREESSLSIVCQLLLEMSNLESTNEKVLVIGITNLLQKIDCALIRSGRIDTFIEFVPPTESERSEVLGKLTKEWKINEKPNKELLLKIAKATDGFTGADLKKLSRYVVDRAINRLLDDDDLNNFQACQEKLKSKTLAITPEDWNSETAAMKLNKQQ